MKKIGVHISYFRNIMQPRCIFLFFKKKILKSHYTSKNYTYRHPNTLEVLLQLLFFIFFLFSKIPFFYPEILFSIFHAALSLLQAFLKFFKPFSAIIASSSLNLRSFTLVKYSDLYLSTWSPIKAFKTRSMGSHTNSIRVSTFNSDTITLVFENSAIFFANFLESTFVLSAFKILVLSGNDSFAFGFLFDSSVLISFKNFEK